MWLLVDDKRDLNCDCIARNYEVAIQLVHLNIWDCICLDHDLGEEKTGYDVLSLIIDLLDKDELPERFQLVTSNPVGRDRMGKLLLNHGYKTINNIDYYKEEK